MGRPGGPTVRLRFRYSKLGKVRFTSHRDVARLWERALRRSGLPVAWSEGFAPRPLLSFGLALPTGAESLGEYLDVRLERPWEGTAGVSVTSDDHRASEAHVPEEPAIGEGHSGAPGGPGSTAGVGLAARLTGMLPEGLTVQVVGVVPHGTGSLQQEVTSCDWEMEVTGVAAAELATRVERLLGAASVVIRRERKGRPVHDDLRPAVRKLTLVADGPDGPASGNGPSRLRAELATRPRGVRPGELLEGLGTGLTLVRACRTHQWIERDGARWEPLALSGAEPVAAVAGVRERAS